LQIVPRPRSSNERGRFISDPYPEKTSLAPLDNAGLELQALGGIEPWSAIHKAMNGANHDYIYNHTEGSDTYKGAKADLLFATGPLNWDGAINLWQYLDYAVHNGGTVNFAYDPLKTEATINKIITATGTPSEIVWSFYHNLDRIARESGNASLMQPDLTQLQTDKPESNIISTQGLWLMIGAGLLGLGLVAYILHES